MRKPAEWLDKENPSAWSIHLEGIEEMFTFNGLGLPKVLHRCLCPTNIIESPYSGVRQKTVRVRRWRDGSMVFRWAACALLTKEKSFRRIMGYQQLWKPGSALNSQVETEMIGKESRVA